MHCAQTNDWSCDNFVKECFPHLEHFRGVRAAQIFRLRLFRYSERHHQAFEEEIGDAIDASQETPYVNPFAPALYADRSGPVSQASLVTLS
jgi:hypothetical protein